MLLQDQCCTLKHVTKEIRWPELFGETGSDIPEKTRRRRWEQWKALLLKDGEQEIVNYWAKDNLEETCSGCIHRDNDWCKHNGLPCNVNPILTFRAGLIGMACMGLGYQSKPEQLELFEVSS